MVSKRKIKESMRIGKISLLMLCLAIGISSCKKDDDTAEIEVTPPRARAEVQAEDDAEIVSYLKSHYYNSSEFESIDDANISNLVITKLADGETAAPDGFTILWNSPLLLKDKTTVFASTIYKYYILKLNQGGGANSPNFSDDIRVNYEGFLLDDEATIFDSAVNPVFFELTSLIPGWRKVMPSFNTAASFVDASDGTVDYIDHGVGVMFIPSGIAYFSTGTTGIGTYTPIAFKFDLVESFIADHDGDGVPSYLEDVSTPKDGEFFIDRDDQDNDDDTDNDGRPDYVDPDDDGDGIPTINEDINGDGDPTNDIGKNGIPNYLDPEETAFR